MVAGALAVAVTNDLWTRIRQVRAQIGVTLGPFEAWLLMRGMKTLDLRVREQSKTAALLVDVRTMDVLAQVGSADFGKIDISGQVDGTRSARSPGSTLPG